MENSLEILLKTKHINTIWPSNPTPGYILREYHNSKRCMHPNIHWSIVYNSQGMETTKMDINRGMDIEDVMHVHSGMLLNHKKIGNCAICKDTNGPRECHTEWSKSERVKQISYIKAYVRNLEKWYPWTDLQSRNWDTNLENKCMDTKGDRVVVCGLGDWDWICTLLCIK